MRVIRRCLFGLRSRIYSRGWVFCRQLISKPPAFLEKLYLLRRPWLRDHPHVGGPRQRRRGPYQTNGSAQPLGHKNPWVYLPTLYAHCSFFFSLGSCLKSVNSSPKDLPGQLPCNANECCKINEIICTHALTRFENG